MSLPTSENIPELNFNFEGLKRHSFLCIFLPEKILSKDDVRLRSWLLHTIVTSARHYSKARELIILQDKAISSQDGGTIFYILDLSEQIEGCITATYRACMAINRMSQNNELLRNFIEQHSTAIDKLGKIRNQFEHMHSQIVSGEIGSGPISITLSDSGKFIKFRRLQMETVALYALIKDLCATVAGLYPGFDINSKPEAGGPVKLTMTATISVVEKNK
jgi:hypothetical protein